MNVVIDKSEYAYFDGKQVQYLIGEIPQTNDGGAYISMGRLFMKRYEFFMRAGQNVRNMTDGHVSAGFWDLEYKVDL